MKYFLRIFLVLQLSLVYGSFDDPNSGWTYVQSVQQSFYIFIDNIVIYDSSGDIIEGYGDGTNPGTSSNSDCVLDPTGCDAVGAFKNHDISQSECSDLSGVYLGEGGCDVCVGWIYYNSYSGETHVTTLPMMGDDNSEGEYEYYMINGDIPKIKFYDASDSTTYSLSPSLYDANLDSDSLGNFYNNAIYVYYADCTDIEDIPDCEASGNCCVDVSFTALCDFDADSDGLCDEVDDCTGSYDCTGECNGSAVEDCAGECNGAAVFDECGECQGDNSTCTGCMDETALNYDPDATIDCAEDCCEYELNNSIQLPDSFDIISIYPNPFNPSTHIKYSLDMGQFISIRVINSNGNEVTSLFSGYKLTGFHDFIWTPDTYIPSGQYFIQISTLDDSLIKKVTYIK